MSGLRQGKRAGPGYDFVIVRKRLLAAGYNAAEDTMKKLAGLPKNR
jgi:hypothetical protein